MKFGPCYSATTKTKIMKLTGIIKLKKFFQKKKKDPVQDLLKIPKNQWIIGSAGSGRAYRIVDAIKYSINHKIDLNDVYHGYEFLCNKYGKLLVDQEIISGLENNTTAYPFISADEYKFKMTNNE